MSKLELPPSREVRLSDGVTHGVYEHLMFTAHSGDTKALLHSMAGAELTDELRRSQAVREYKAMLMARLMVAGGTLVADDLEKMEEEWHELDVLDLPHPNISGVEFDG